MPEYWFVSVPGEGNRTVTFQNFKAKIASSQNDLAEVAPLPIPEFKVPSVPPWYPPFFDAFPFVLLLGLVENVRAIGAAYSISGPWYPVYSAIRCKDLALFTDIANGLFFGMNA
jgi:hypothetical protein